MKKNIKRTIVILLIILTIFNYIYGNFVPVYGTTAGEALTELAETIINLLMNLLGGIVGIFTWPFRLIAMGIAFAANVLTANIAYMDGATEGNVSILNHISITPFDIFFNQVQLLDVNFLDVNVTGFLGAQTTTGIIRTAVAKWYYIVRLISVAILLLILLYVGIRMAITSVASEKANYKRALVDWVVSLALIFVLQYIVLFTVNFNNAIVNALAGLADASGISNAILGIALTSLGVLWDSMAATLVYCMIVFQTFVFLLRYMKRMLTIGFLIIISPLISITYSIDKMGDQKAQALNSWLKEFIYNVLIQPFHCVMYLAFVEVAFDLLVTDSLADIVGQFADSQLVSAIVAIMCLKFIDDGEKIIRKIFGFGQASSLAPLEVAAMATALKQNSEKIVKSADTIRKGINTSKQNGLLAAVKKDINTRQDNKLIAKQTKENVKQGMSQEQAAASAKQTVAAARTNRETMKNIKSRNTKKRNEKIESKMAESMPKGEFQQLKDRINNGTATKADLDKFRAAYDKADRETAKSNQRGRNISGAKGGFFPETTKMMMKNALPIGVGIALGGMTLGGANMLAAWGVGNTAYQGTQAFRKNSTKTIANNARSYVKDRVNNSQELNDYAHEVSQKGENGAYENKSDDTKDLVNRLQNAIATALGTTKDDPSVSRKTKQVTDEISRDLLDDPDTFDLSEILAKAGVQNPEVQNAAENFADHKKDGYFYQQMQRAESLNVPFDEFIERIDRELNYENSDDESTPAPTYSDSQRAEPIYPEQEEAGEASPVVHQSNDPQDADNIVREIRREENITEVINKVDSGDLDLVEELVRKLEEQIQEIQKIDLFERTEEAKLEMERMERARDTLKNHINNSDQD